MEVKKEAIWTAASKGRIDLFDQLVNAFDGESLLYERGDQGEQPIHVCFLKSRNKMAKHIIEKYPSQAAAVYEGKSYKGESCLHIAIVSQNKKMVQYLVGKEPKLVSMRTIGAFFKKGKPCYYGEWPLFFAACTNQVDTVEFLLDNGADITCQDSQGNTILHMMVYHQLTNMYDYLSEKAKELRPEVDLSLVVNKKGLTPLTLAAKKGNAEMFAQLLERRKQIQWAYGPISYNLYPLEELDSTRRTIEKKKDKIKGALQHIIEQEHVDLLQVGPIKQILDRKWEIFAQSRFFSKMWVTGAYLFILMFLIIARSNPDACPTLIRWLLDIGVALGATYKLSIELTEMRGGVLDYFSVSGSALLENTTALLFSGSIVVHYVLVLIGSRYEEAVLMVSPILGWIYMLFFFLGFRFSGPFVIMIVKIIISDFMKFFALQAVFVMGFSQSLYLQFGAGKWAAIVDIISMNWDDYESLYENAKFPWVSLTILVIYMVLSGTLLLNLLVAMVRSDWRGIEVNRWEIRFRG
eukprot:TRINITY_DN9770_c0_g1_i2.p1 TRINITY_DN9770_c0_g1~~TRINITY_DN9770_c0_g1_i2.p1  ORF type:complete len:522 (-),score=121.86 TRINITY_DN9770_c0_g1_i2:288-1853(-)